MTNMSRRDRTILAVVGMVILYAAGVGFWFLSQQNAWKAAQKKYLKERTKRVAEQRLIAARNQWFEDYEAERSKMPAFPDGDQGVDTHWLGIMDKIAENNHIRITRRQAGKEETVGDVFELPITIPDWEGSLECLVKFMFALETAQGAMFDIRQIEMAPLQKNRGCLRGKFTLSCAYMRGAEDEEEETETAAEEPAIESETKTEKEEK